MSRVLFIRPTDLQDGSFEHVGARADALDLVRVDNLEAAWRRLDAEGFAAVLLAFDADVGACAALLDELLESCLDLPVVCLVRDGDHRSAAQVVRRAPTDFVFADQLLSAEAPVMLEAIIERVASQAREARLQRQLERRNAELLGLNALASAVSSSLNRDIIIRRALWVFSGLCRRGAAALIQLEPAPSLAPPADEGQVDPRSEQVEEVDEADVSLSCAGEFAVDSLPVCGELDSLGRWLELIRDDGIVVLEDVPQRGEYPGIEPLVDRLDGGSVNLVPLWGQGRAIGVLVLAELAPGLHMPFTREALRAMASQLGGALENARLFEEVTSAYRSLQSAQDQLVHAEKFAAMGVLAAEIAHEINNPASFVISNLSVMVDYVETIGEFLEQLNQRVAAQAPQLVDEVNALAQAHEIAFLREDLDTLLSRSLGGMQRIHQIVQDLRFFSHDTANEPGWVDVESLLQATLNLVKHEAKYRARLEFDFGDVPQVFSDANRLSQVFLNLLVNATHAIDTGTIDDNVICVQTHRDGDNVAVVVRDTGTGIAPEILPHIFDPFFTTKDPGEGTGLGLSISRDIVRSLGGEISVKSEVGKGSTFQVVVPIRATKFEQDETLRDSGSYTSVPSKQGGASEAGGGDDDGDDPNDQRRQGVDSDE